ncbi:hypothetical protein I4U23_014522 [Adineta vaga]|nr:hypothetical protein I4U23_014522 [Adineta vaga]
MNSSSFSKHRHRAEKTFVKALYGLSTEYETPKSVLIRSLSLTILLRVMQILLLVYSVLYLLLYEKGYQKQDTAIISSTTLKVKGIGFIRSQHNKTIIIDVAEARCKTDEDCVNKAVSSKASGRWTGRCLIPPTMNIFNKTSNSTKQSLGLCEYAGWCPPENDEVDSMYVNEFLNFTIFIKNFIEFPIFRVKHKNMVDNLKACVFHPQFSPDCPIFSLGYILNQAENDSEERALMLRYGGVVSVKLDWDCNLDRDVKLCKPEYTFVRLDVPFRDKPFSRGFNFRYASQWKYLGSTQRTLTKAYGLRLIIAVSGKAGKFDLITLSLNIGSSVGIFGLAIVFCNILLYLSKQSRTYQRHICEAVHSGTRFNSVSEDDNDGGQTNGVTHKLSITSNEETPRLTRKTVSMRPLILIIPDQLTNSELT